MTRRLETNTDYDKTQVKLIRSEKSGIALLIDEIRSEIMASNKTTMALVKRETCVDFTTQEIAFSFQEAEKFIELLVRIHQTRCLRIAEIGCLGAEKKTTQWHLPLTLALARSAKEMQMKRTQTVSMGTARYGLTYK